MELDIHYLEELETYMASGRMTEDFEDAFESRKHHMLEFLEKLMDLAELADATATRMIFKETYAEAAKPQK